MGNDFKEADKLIEKVKEMEKKLRKLAKIQKQTRSALIHRASAYLGLQSSAELNPKAAVDDL